MYVAHFGILVTFLYACLADRLLKLANLHITHFYEELACYLAPTAGGLSK